MEHTHDHDQHEKQQDHNDHNSHNSHDDHHDHHAMMVADFKKRFFVSLVLMVPILALSPMIQSFMGVEWQFGGDSYILFGLSTVLFFYGGKPFFSGAKDELGEKNPAMMTLIAFAITVAYFYSSMTVFFIEGTGFFWELATLIVVMLLGHWIEMKSVMGASKALDELLELMPDQAHQIGENGETQEVPVSDLQTGDRVLVKPGEKIPIDGTIYEGASEVNESMVTGESVPVEKSEEDEVIGGTINGEGILKFKVSKVGEDTFLSQVVRLVKEAQESKSKTQTLADTAAKWLFYIAITAGAITFFAWWGLGRELNFVIERTVTVVIIACPHALGLAIPLVSAVSTSMGAKRGLLIRQRVPFENARNIDAVVFDKTGTLTEGKFGVTDLAANDGFSEEELLTVAYSLEANSEHPIAQGIVREGEKRELQKKEIKDYQNLTGKGLEASIDGERHRIVSPGYMKEKGIDYDEKHYQKLAREGKTVVFVLKDQILLGMIALSDMVRDTAKEAVKRLKALNIESIMLTGDNQQVADYVGKKLQIDTIFAQVLPEEKSQKIAALKEQGKKVAMTGDGVNDAPSLAKADLGIAIGAGTDVAIETADVILVKSNPMDVVHLIQLSKETYKKMVQNLIWATAYNAIALPLAAGVLYNQGIVVSPALGAVFMSLSTVIVAINAVLLKRK